jgi:hypothetical protein
MGSSESKSSGFTVTDRRAFTDESEARGPAKESGDTSAPGAETGPTGPISPAAAGEQDARALPAVDFHTFVLSLGSSALLHLGELEHPEAGASGKDLPLAKHTIDILAMLEEKTRGNLTPAEEKLIQSLLYDLRLRYVDACKAAGK